jgi:CDP-diacylglycerol--glycerol-3-phosphate 3-phosphatidyltransferase
MANVLTLVRVALIFFVVAVWARGVFLNVWWLDLVMVPLLAWAIFMDALDGWVARRRHETSESGALLDIAGDRIVELVLWVFFAIPKADGGRPLVAYWIPVVIITRTVLTDFVRSVAFGEGKTPFGEKTMMESGWAKQLVSSRWSRAAYGIMKAVAFCALGLLLAFSRMGVQGAYVEAFRVVVDVLVYLTAGFCIVRAVPVLWDGRRYVGATPSRPA